MEKFVKPATLLPILIGIAAGTLLFIFGASEDAPGMCLIGLSVAFLLIMWGIYNTGIIKKGFALAIISYCFGAGAILLSIVLLLDGEFGDYPHMAVIGVSIGFVLIAIGTIKLRKARGGGKNV